MSSMGPRGALRAPGREVQREIRGYLRKFIFTQLSFLRPFLPMVAKADVTFEVGPVAHGTLRAEATARARSLVLDTLGWLDRLNRGLLRPEEAAAKALVVYVQGRSVDYPRFEDGSISACIAPSLQDRDFELLRPGDPVFQDLVTGDLILWEGEECYPIFINEASYTEKRIAFTVTYRHVLRLPAFARDAATGLYHMDRKDFVDIDRAV
ncbi:unnamed protein product [Prorocentrum cordatum]|uniref:AstE/AspA barrel-sandwich hybrid domain-containing protein n=1 Tax=Prorocentrum cordatum TaxID=2364126 RepID=A0ABN9WMF0_9DINO|nr:unnamed protein product [Polarella glacialis]